MAVIRFGSKYARYMKYIIFFFSLNIVTDSHSQNHLNNLTVMDAEFVGFLFVTYWTQDMAASLLQLIPLILL